MTVFAVLLLAWSSPVAASGPTGVEAFQPVLILLGVVSAAYAVTHLFSGWLSRRLGIVTGVEYLVLGAIVGPLFGVLDEEVVGKLSPALVLGTGSLGLLTGLQVNLRRATRRLVWKGALIVSATTLATVALVPLLVIGSRWPAELETYLPHFLCLGAVALVADPAPLRSIAAFLEASGGGTEIAAGAARVCSSVAVLIFGVVFCAAKPPAELFGFYVAGAQAVAFWLLIHAALGIVVGVVFATFLVSDSEDDKLLTVVIGVVIFTSGLAFYLEVSPIFVNFLVGLTLVVLRKAESVERMLESVERPLYIVLFFFAGASLSFAVSYWTYVLFAPYLILRFAGRSIGGFLAKRLSRSVRAFPSLSGVLWAPGGLSVAMALNFNTVYAHVDHASELYVVVLVAVLASEAIAYRSARRWVIDATDVSLVRTESG